MQFIITRRPFFSFAAASWDLFCLFSVDELLCFCTKSRVISVRGSAEGLAAENGFYKTPGQSIALGKGVPGIGLRAPPRR